MSKVYGLFLAIVCALPADKIDTAVNDGKELKKSIREKQSEKGDQL